MFEFGFDYPDVPIPTGSPIQLRVYVALVSENRSSPFLKGISLQLDNASLYADGMPRSGVRIAQRQEANIESYSFQLPDTSFLAPGSSHNITAALSFSLVDVNYVGFLKGPSMNVMLTGKLMVANTA
jgi:hypothetical protein